MQQLEIEYFFPLTEQINLDLDFTQCEEYHKQKLQQMWSSGQVLVAGGGGIDSPTWANIEPTFQFKPESDTVGFWEISKGVQVWRKVRPHWLHQKMTKVFFGWEWNDR